MAKTLTSVITSKLLNQVKLRVLPWSVASVQGRWVYLGDDLKMKPIHLFLMHQFLSNLAYAPVSFKLGMVLDISKLCCLIPVLVSLTFTQGHRAEGRVKLVQPLCCKRATKTSAVVDHIRGTTVNCVKYDEHGSFKNLLFLFMLKHFSSLKLVSCFKRRKRSGGCDFYFVVANEVINKSFV